MSRISPLARVAAGAITGVLLACAATPTAAGGIPKPDPTVSAPNVIRVLQPRPPVGVVLTATPTLLPTTSRHSAFPGMTRDPSGDLELVWRGATDHVNTRDGDIKTSTGLFTGQGITWMPEDTLLTGEDFRDPSVSYIDDHRWLSYFTGTNTTPAGGAYVIKDDGPPVRVDGGMPYAAVSAPVVKLPSGQLAVPFYGRLANETKDTAWVATSSDSGVTWTKNRILNPAIETTPEPWIVVDGDRTLYFARWGDNALAVCTSWDSMQTCHGLGIIRNQATGRPNVTRTASGLLILVYRSLPTKSAQIAFSPDRGVSWYDSTQLMAAPTGSPSGMTYAAFAPTNVPGVTLTVFGMEQANGSSQLWSAYLAESVR